MPGDPRHIRAAVDGIGGNPACGRTDPAGLAKALVDLNGGQQAVREPGFTRCIVGADEQFLAARFDDHAKVSGVGFRCGEDVKGIESEKIGPRRPGQAQSCGDAQPNTGESARAEGHANAVHAARLSMGGFEQGLQGRHQNRGLPAIHAQLLPGQNLTILSEGRVEARTSALEGQRQHGCL